LFPDPEQRDNQIHKRRKYAADSLAWKYSQDSFAEDEQEFFLILY
jgi:hypothetical protein